jgi:hypothetical protein
MVTPAIAPAPEMPAGVGGDEIGKGLRRGRGVLHAGKSSSQAQTAQPRYGTLFRTSRGAKRLSAYLKRPETYLLNDRVNERLRTAMMRTGIDVSDLALCCGVDVKTAERWVSPAGSRTAPTAGPQPGA